MCWNWPSWVNFSEFQWLHLAKKLLSPASFLSLFSVGWEIVGLPVTVPVCRAAPLSPPALPASCWPTLLFSPGMGCSRTTMSQLCYQLASRGVVVAALEHRDGSGHGSFTIEEDGRQEDIPHLAVPVDCNEYRVRHGQVQHRAEEIVRAVELLARLNRGEQVENCLLGGADLTMFHSRLDMEENLFLAGHSFGGGSVLLAQPRLPEVRAVLCLDPWMFPLHQHSFTITAPTLVVNTETFLNPRNIEVIEAAAAKSDTVRFSVLRGGVHLSATDVPSCFPGTSLKQGLGFMSYMQPEQVMEKTNQIVWNWVKSYSKQA